jgi:oxaloacetate decarboxylase alpha subunit
MTELRLVDVTMRDGNQSLGGDWPRYRADARRRRADRSLRLPRDRFHLVQPHGRGRALFPRQPVGTHPPDARGDADHALQFITTGLRFIAWQQPDPEFMRLVYRQLQRDGIGRFVLLDPMLVPAVIEAARLVKQEGEAEVMCALTFTLSNIHTDAFYADFARAVGRSADIDLFLSRTRPACSRWTARARWCPR